MIHCTFSPSYWLYWLSSDIRMSSSNCYCWIVHLRNSTTASYWRAGTQPIWDFLTNVHNYITSFQSTTYLRKFISQVHLLTLYMFNSSSKTDDSTISFALFANPKTIFCWPTHYGLFRTCSSVFLSSMINVEYIEILFIKNNLVPLQFSLDFFFIANSILAYLSVSFDLIQVPLFQHIVEIREITFVTNVMVIVIVLWVFPFLILVIFTNFKTTEFAYI